MSKLKTVKVGEVSEQIRGVSYIPSDSRDKPENGFVPVLRAHNIQEDGLNDDSLVFVKSSRINSRQFINKGDIVICASSGSKALVGKSAQAKSDAHYSFGAFCKVIRPIGIHPEYLGYFFQSNRYRNEISALSTGTSINNLKNEHLNNLTLPLPPLEVQKRIAATLDSISNLIRLRKRQLEELDLLVKSRFVEMFGDPVSNPYKWPIVNITSILRGKASNGFFAKRDAYNDVGNVSILGVVNIVNRMYSQIDNLPRTNGSITDIKKYCVEYGDILFCRSSLVAEGIGKASIVPSNTPMNTLFECHVIRLPLSLKLCVPEYIQVFTTTDFFRQQILSQSKTSTMTTISQEGILKSKIILPPLTIQKGFATFIEQIGKTKLSVQQSVLEMVNLQESLMKIYFSKVLENGNNDT